MEIFNYEQAEDYYRDGDSKVAYCHKDNAQPRILYTLSEAFDYYNN